jgi:hypothetical protein
VRASPPEVVARVLDGKGREIGVIAVTLIKANRRLQLIGTLPADYQNYLSYTAAQLVSARSPQAAGEFIDFLSRLRRGRNSSHPERSRRDRPLNRLRRVGSKCNPPMDVAANCREYSAAFDLATRLGEDVLNDRIVEIVRDEQVRIEFRQKRAVARVSTHLAVGSVCVVTTLWDTIVSNFLEKAGFALSAYRRPQCQERTCILFTPAP